MVRGAPTPLRIPPPVESVCTGQETPRGKEASGLTLSLATGLCQLSQGRLSTLLPGVLPLLDPLHGVPNPSPHSGGRWGLAKGGPPTFFLSLINGGVGVAKVQANLSRNF